jgi:hypothetical protein
MNDEQIAELSEAPEVGNASDFWSIWIGRADKSLGLEHSEWANPYTVHDFGVEKSIELYEEFVRARPSLMEKIPSLRGKLLACKCRSVDDPKDGGKPCHGDVLRSLYIEWAKIQLETDPNYFAKKV